VAYEAKDVNKAVEILEGKGGIFKEVKVEKILKLLQNKTNANRTNVFVNETPASKVAEENAKNGTSASKFESLINKNLKRFGIQICTNF
jgi:hypothetical protein